MKKYTIEELSEALEILKTHNNSNVIDDFKKNIENELRIRNKPKFIKAPDSYIKKLKRQEIEIRYLNENDDFYYPGMQGMFEKKTGQLLRRHTDTGLLGLNLLIR